MPPKKKGGKGKGGTGNIIDGVDTTQMTREQLEVFCHRIKEENEREREERNFFQLERDKLRTFWEITKNELEEARAKLRNKDRQIEEAAEKNEEELKFYKQKVKHLQYEHQNNLTECKAEALVSLKMAQDDHTEQERELLRDKRDLKAQMREQELSHQDQVKSLKLQQSEEISIIRTQFEEKEKELENKYEKKFGDLKQELNTKHNMEMAEMEERKNNQITDLTKHHEKVFNEMKNYYNDITLNNLALISSLKNTKAKLAVTKQELDDLRWANDALELRFEKLQAEKDELSRRFVNAILEVQQKTGQKNILLQKRVQTLSDVAEYRDVIIGELRASVDGAQVRSNQKLEKILAKKNTVIHDLQYELARVCKAHDDLLDTYEAKLQQYGIPKDELGFVPLRILPESQGGLAKGPAGLVTKNR
ncbi:growth arrest-specific protein 8 [Asbolus verrucosus]|uniref:Dynein regulatory complex subunit 4 n=1 Tax=Asbolus verrucosus TaxID=1661398 RepID=A0A482WDX0_ASBVE|nr:growth arrest-specific protein 8 [Asbolus verrucosus]